MSDSMGFNIAHYDPIECDGIFLYSLYSLWKKYVYKEYIYGKIKEIT